MSEHDDTPLDPEELEPWEAEAPPAGFADRVMAARQARAAEPAAEAEAETGRRRRWGTATIVVVAAAAIALLVHGRPAPLPASSGVVDVSSRTEVALGHRGVAVAEANASLRWRIVEGAAVIEQDRGNVFYRVERGGPFTVHTPHGRVVVEGTSFRVEVRTMKPSKQSLRGAAVGAAVAAALVVTVYEGRVLFAGDDGTRERASAGERLLISGAEPGVARSITRLDDGAATLDPADPMLTPPGDTVSREELLARDAVQRERLAAMHRELAELRTSLVDARQRVRQGGPRDDKDWLNPSPETLESWVAECRVRMDMPPLPPSGPFELRPDMAQRAGLSEPERLAANQVLAQIHREWTELVRALYLDATGDVGGAESLSTEAMAREIVDKSLPGEEARIRAKLARERAGLAPTPADQTGMTPLERLYRFKSTVGDRTETLLADKIGKARAREMRERDGGWGMRSEIAGCAEEE